MIAVYVSNAESGDISVLHLDTASGVLTPVQLVAVGGKVMPLALSPDRRRLYAARRSDPLEVLSFAIDAASGELTPLGSASLPHSMAYIATDPQGRFMFSASYGGDQIAVSAIDGNGVVQAAQQVRPTGRHAHAIQADPSGRFVFATSLGGGVVMQFLYDAATGQLTANTPALLSPHEAASPRHFVFSRDARFVYLINELDAFIDVLAFDERTGTLQPVQKITSLPPGFDGAAWASDLHLTPDGQFLYSSERGSHTLAAFRVDRASGLLSLIAHCPTETQPRGFNITPDGQFLIAAGELSHRVSVYRIDAQRGTLESVGGCAVGQGPNWIESIALTQA
jgi:6-phosphogluconolactonase